MAFIISKKTTYEVPEDDYRAVVRDAFEQNDGCFRIVFEITSKVHPVLTYLAGKNYKPGKRSLVDDLYDWLGLKGVQQVINEDRTIDAAKLKGREADIRITHISRDEHAQPYSYVNKITPPGELVDFQSAA